jgi:hypothetical protein
MHFIHRKPAVAYQGSAFLMGYYAGVTQALLEAKPAVLVSLSSPANRIDLMLSTRCF